jgi:hypothetical protein
MKQSGRPRLLFREKVAVTVAVHEGKYGRILLLSRPLQALEKALPTAEPFHVGKRTQMKAEEG